MIRRPLLLLATSLFLVTGCAAGSPEPEASPVADDSPTAEGHGSHAGAEELGEPQSAILAIAADGTASLLDLATGEESAVGATGAPASLASDGRYAFVTTGSGVDIVDGGAWSWDHGDHFHFYRAEPRVSGSIAGSGAVHITTPPLATRGATGLFFADGTAVAVDMAALDRGEIDEWFRIDTGAESGVVAPAGAYAIVAANDEARVYDDSGEAVGEPVACAEPSGAITTRVGTVIGCADGALLATTDAGPVDIERIPAPEGERATGFDGRKGRPTVSAVSGENAFWLLDTRARSWERVEVDARLTHVTAADDRDGNVVAIDAEGRVRVYGPDGSDRGATEPIAGEGATLVVDTSRAYLTDPASDTVYEIDYADGARIARELSPGTDLAAATVVGR